MVETKAELMAVQRAPKKDRLTVLMKVATMVVLKAAPTGYKTVCLKVERKVGRKEGTMVELMAVQRE